MSTTAGMNGIEALYHYERFNSDRLGHLLSTNSIYLSNTKGFNDPWDCRPCFDLSQLDDPAFYARQVDYFVRVNRTRNRFLSNEEHSRREQQLRVDRGFLEHCIREMVGIETAIQRRYRVYCLSTKPDDTLMWSHYSENHRGICLEFRSDNGVLSGALQVEYRDAYPPIDLADNNPATVLIALLAKARDWQYENEYRLIAQEESEATNHNSLMTRNNFLPLPNGALSSIIIGCVAPDTTREAVREIVATSGRDIQVKHAVRVPNNYRLTIEAI